LVLLSEFLRRTHGGRKPHFFIPFPSASRPFPRRRAARIWWPSMASRAWRTRSRSTSSRREPSTGSASDADGRGAGDPGDASAGAAPISGSKCSTHNVTGSKSTCVISTNPGVGPGTGRRPSLHRSPVKHERRSSSENRRSTRRKAPSTRMGTDGRGPEHRHRRAPPIFRPRRHPRVTPNCG